MMMRRNVLSFIAIFLISFSTYACDICGCGIGTGYIGILPDFSRHVFGVRYRYNSMYTHLGVDGAFTYLTAKERYTTVEAWSGWNISDKVRVMASVPFSFDEGVSDGVKRSKKGLGDISVTGYYQVLNTKQTAGKKLLVQSLWLGGGVKFASGQYNPSDKSTTGNNTNAFQLGTGSNDFNISGMYDVRLQDAGINLFSNYKIATANRYSYRYGNKFNINSQAYYKFRIKNKFMFAPNAGVQYETAASDLDKGFNVTVSGGNLLLGTVGVETSFNKIVAGANFQRPLSQNLANGIVKANDRVMVHVAFTW